MVARNRESGWTVSAANALFDTNGAMEELRRRSNNMGYNFISHCCPNQTDVNHTGVKWPRRLRQRYLRCLVEYPLDPPLLVLLQVPGIESRRACPAPPETSTRPQSIRAAAPNRHAKIEFGLHSSGQFGTRGGECRWLLSASPVEVPQGKD